MLPLWTELFLCAPKCAKTEFSVGTCRACPLYRGRYTGICMGFPAKPNILKREVPNKMANEARVKVTLVCTECKQRNYDTKKNKKNDPDRLEMKKHCRFCRKHTLHKESK